MRTSSDHLHHLPAALYEVAAQRWSQFQEAAQVANVTPPSHPELLPVLRRVWACSDFVAQSCIQHPPLLHDLLSSGDLLRAYHAQEYAGRLELALATVRDEETLGDALRRLRRREMVRIAWRDLAGWAPLAETLQELSALAEACVDAALQHLHIWQARDYGTPRDAAGVAQSLVVIAMGKLGGGELNFSSDIDLIFAYPADGETRGKRQRISNEEYFLRLGQGLIAALGAVTTEGFVFRMDVRLRPFGDSGPLSVSFVALEEYYQVHGREWERYAWIKARVVGGDRTAGAQLLDTLRPFVYRRYLDFGVFESLREMKRMIREDTARKGIEDNIKLGPGGIREIEFIAQVFQLIRGGRNPDLQIRPTLAVLAQLTGHGYLPEQVTRELTASYVFLRRTENRLQEVADEQTHRLPVSDFERARLAFAMGYRDWAVFDQALHAHRAQVQSHFEQVFAAPQVTAEHAADADLSRLWRAPSDEAGSVSVLNAHGFVDAAEAWRRIAALRDSSAYRALSTQGHERMDRLMPLVLGAVAAQTQQHAGAEAHITLARMLNLIETIARRTPYLVLLAEHPLALSQLVRLCAASPWIASLLARHPVLLDELLDARALYRPVQAAQLDTELRAALIGIAQDDLEQRMDRLRQFKQAQVLRTAAADSAGKLDVAAVSAQLSVIAEVSLDAALDMAWSETLKRHTTPAMAGFAVAGYGKLGARELNYASDLDLIFLYDAAEQGGEDSGIFFARLAQRLIRILNAHTAAGVLYEVDVRLRPDGASGLLVSSFAAFSDYQRSRAWTWEHQSLVRARVVAQRGGGRLAQRLDALRAEILSRSRNVDELRREVRDMRERMRRELGSHEAGLFDLKQDAGGIVDIEFMVQYGVLAWAHTHADLVQARSVTELLGRFAQHRLMAKHDARRLREIYDHYRSEIDRCALQQCPLRVPAAPFAAARAEVMRLWREWLEPARSEVP